MQQQSSSDILDGPAAGGLVISRRIIAVSHRQTCEESDSTDYQHWQRVVDDELDCVLDMFLNKYMN